MTVALPGRIALEGEMTIYRATELKLELLAGISGASAGSAEVVFDLSRVSEIDTAGVQLLLLARREAATRGGRLRLVAPSAAVSDAFTLLELTSCLDSAVDA